MPPLRIMCLGDSITAGSPAFTGGYRQFLSAYFDLHGVSYEYVGRETDPGGDHEGYSGHTTAQILAEALVAIPLLEPDIVLIIAGTNDVSASTEDPDDYVEACETIKALPGVDWVLAGTIPPRGDFPYVEPTQEFNDALPAAFADADDGVLLFDVCGTLVYPDDMADTAHPNDDGYAEIGEAWLAAFQSIGLAVAPRTRLEGKLDMRRYRLPLETQVTRTLTVDEVTYDEGGVETARERYDLTPATVVLTVRDSEGTAVITKRSDSDPLGIEKLEQSGLTLGRAGVRFLDSDTEDLDPSAFYSVDVWVYREDAFDTVEQVIPKRPLVIGASSL